MVIIYLWLVIPNQGIYGFRGSDSTILEDYEKNHNPQVLHLTENHRSTPQIVEISNNLIVNNFNKFNLPLVSTLKKTVLPSFLMVNPSQKASFRTSSIASIKPTKPPKASASALLLQNPSPRKTAGKFMPKSNQN